MLRFNPLERLGAGSDSNNLGYESLLRHHFFAGINFNSVHVEPSPLLAVFESLEHHHHDELYDSDEED